jgi:predicted HTH domain antitoxin
MPPKKAHLAAEKEGRILLAIKAYQTGQISNIRAAAEAFDVSRSTLSDRIRGRAARVDKTASVGNNINNMILAI